MATSTSLPFTIRVQPRPADGWGEGTAVGSYDEASSTWTPGRDEDGVIHRGSLDALPTLTWIEVAGSDLLSNVKPALDAAGCTIYRAGSDGVGATLTNYNGMAWDDDGGRAWAHGRGHAGGSDNRVDELNLFRMTWGTVARSQKVGANGWTAEHDAFYRNYQSYNGLRGLAAARNVALSSSPTGFALPYGTSFSCRAEKASLATGAFVRWVLGMRMD